MCPQGVLGSLVIISQYNREAWEALAMPCAAPARASGAGRCRGVGKPGWTLMLGRPGVNPALTLDAVPGTSSRTSISPLLKWDDTQLAGGAVRMTWYRERARPLGTQQVCLPLAPFIACYLWTSVPRCC